MRRVLSFVCAVLVSTSAFAGDIAVIEPGEFHGSDVEAINVKNGEMWVGLFPRGDGYFWEDVRVRVAVTRDEMVDEEGKATGRTFTAMSSIPPLLLVRGVDGLPSKRVVPLKLETSLENGSVEMLSLNGVVYRVVVTNAKSEAKTISEGSSIALESGGVRQELFAVPEGANEPDWRLLWAGDLDGDGKLDLYMDLSNHYNISEKRLFLSSMAEPGKLVKQVAEFVTTGC